ncbi:hypothetical protein OAQ99_06905 [Candidatus Kapabacteria bacterium]|nr:hypothetical protein [Candidatus Kapabacteria bacterium]
MYKIKYIALLAMASLFFVSCDDDDDDDDTVVENTSYFPLTVGSTWQRDRAEDGEYPAGTENITVLEEETVNGMQYVKVDGDLAGSFHEDGIYFRNDGNKIYELIMHTSYTKFEDDGSSNEIDTLIYEEALYLDWDQGVGTTWDEHNHLAFLSQGEIIFGVESKKTITEKMDEMVVDGMTYMDVIKVENTFYQPFQDIYASQTYNYYYSKGVGLIKGESIGSEGSIDHITLKSYSIK